MKFIRKDGTIVEEDDHLSFTLEAINSIFSGKKKTKKPKVKSQTIDEMTLTMLRQKRMRNALLAIFLMGLIGALGVVRGW